MNYLKNYFTAFSFFLAFGAICSAQGIEFFEGSWDEALELAEKEDKLIYINCFAVWCGPCRRMANHVFPDEKVGLFFNSNFINLKLDMEQSPGREFGRKYPVSGFPTHYFIDKSGEVVLSVAGGRDVNGIVQLAEQALARYNPNIGYSDRFAEGDRSSEVVYYHLENLKRGNEDILSLANEHFSRTSNLDDPYNLKILVIAMTESDSRLFNQFIQNKDRIISEYDEDFYFTKIRDAGWNTLRKAMNFREPFLRDEAIKNMKRAGLTDANSFEIKANLYFATRIRDKENFVTYFERFLDEEGIDDPAACIEFYDLGFRAFGEDPKLVEVATAVGRIARRTENAELHYRHAKVLHLQGNERQAERAIDRAIDLGLESEIEKYEEFKSRITQ
ncbi:MAG: DUF255 domain-containing protein [Saprospirales bacterium]|nr:MAG: DUF255 domain-containing protein [Saprospirales bacterium]